MKVEINVIVLLYCIVYLVGIILNILVQFYPSSVVDLTILCLSVFKCIFIEHGNIIF